MGASAESLFAFFGRADELTRLGEAQKAASDGHLQVTLVSGEPGIGKTMLVAQAARAAHGAGVNVVYGGCEEGLGVPYQPWIAALSQLVEHADEAPLHELVAAHGVTIARLVPAVPARRLGVPVPDGGGDADAERFLLLEGATRLLAALSTDTPVLVVLDDLHWVDAASLQLLRHLVASGLPMAVHVAGTFRESDLARTHPLVSVLADLRRESCVDRVDLVGLDDVDILDLLNAAAGHDVAEDGVALAHALRRETAGNPFFLVEVIRHLAETGAFAQDDEGRWGLSADLDALGLPSSVREVVADRVARLGEESEKVLTTASVVGREFDLDLLATLTGLDEDHLLDLLDDAINAGIINAPEHAYGRYRFVHALIQHTLYQDVSAPRRQRTHQRIAEALEARSTDEGEPVAVLAHHWLAATRPADADKALHYARRAGEEALAAHAPADAVGWYTQALELLARRPSDIEHDRCLLLVGLGTAQRQTGQPEHRDTLREARRIALARGDRDLLVTVALARDPGFETMSEVDPDRLAVLEAALAAVGPADSPDRARLLAGLAEEWDPRDVEARCGTAMEAIDVAARISDEPAELATLSLALNPLFTPDTRDRRVQEAERALQLAERLGDVTARCHALNYGAQAAMEQADIDEYDRRLAELEVIVERTNLPFERGTLLMMRSWRHLLAGRYEEAEADSEAMVAVSTEAGHPTVAASYGAQLLQRWRQQGRLAELLVDVAAQGLAENPTIPAWRTAVMDVYTELGRRDEAEGLFEVGLASGFSDLPFDSTWYQSAGQYADCAAELGRTDAAPLLHELLEPYADRYAYLFAIDWGAVARPLGRLATLLGRHDEAEAHLRAALTTHERIQAPYWVARTQLDLVELSLARRGPQDADAASTLLDAVEQSIERHGHAGLRPRLDRLAGRV